MIQRVELRTTSSQLQVRHTAVHTKHNPCYSRPFLFLATFVRCIFTRWAACCCFFVERGWRALRRPARTSPLQESRTPRGVLAPSRSCYRSASLQTAEFPQSGPTRTRPQTRTGASAASLEQGTTPGGMYLRLCQRHHSSSQSCRPRDALTRTGTIHKMGRAVSYFAEVTETIVRHCVL